MKRSIIAVALCGLVLSACGKDTDIGSGVNTTLAPPPPTNSPTPTLTPIETKTKETEPPKETKPPSRPIENYRLRVRNPGSGFQPDSIRLVQGDTITFYNDDPNNDHQLIIHEEGGSKELFVGKTLSPGEKQKLTVDLEAGRYGYKDGAVPYIQGGVLEVLRVA